MPIQITMPRLSDTMQEGTLNKWHVKTGDKVKSGDVLADVETDKATMELQSFDDGTVARLAVEEGQTVAVGRLIAVLARAGESIDDAASTGDDPSASAQPAASGGAASVKADERGQEQNDEPDAQGADEHDEQPAANRGGGRSERGAAVAERVRISPLARKLAEDMGVDVSGVKGCGPDGRIIKRDVLAAQLSAAAGGRAAPPAVAPRLSAAAPAPTPPPAKLESKTVALSNMRKTIARRLVESKTTIPHFTVTLSVNMDPLLALRETLNTQLESQGVKLSVNDFLVRAVALALLQHPAVNSSWTDQGIAQHGTVNVGVAVALPEDKGGGLVVPVIRDTHAKGLRAISQETRALSEKARTRGLSIDEMSEGTFTLSNLGMFGVDHFEAIINPPQAAILAVGGALKKPVVRDGQMTIGQEMTCTLSADHRVVDGATAAQFLQTLRGLLENPAALLV